MGIGSWGVGDGVLGLENWGSEVRGWGLGVGVETRTRRRDEGKTQMGLAFQFPPKNHFSRVVDEDEDEENGDLPIGARPRRMSHVPAQKMQKPIPRASSLFFFSHTNPFRVFCNKIVNHQYFTNSVLVCILVSSAMLAAEDPLQAQSYRNTILNYFDYFFTTVFTVEITLKVRVGWRL